MSNQTLSQLTHDQKLEWFQNHFRPRFELWVVDPVVHVMQLPQGKMPAFVWLTCATDWLAGFFHGEPTKNNVKKCYTTFVEKYFPLGKYVAEDLYDSLRNGLVHMYTIKGKKYALTHENPSWHLEQSSEGHRLLNLEDFFADWISAKDSYFEAVVKEPDLLDKFIERYERDGFLGLISVEVAQRDIHS